MLSSIPLIAQAFADFSTEANRIASDGAAGSQAVIEQINALWDDVLGGGLYAALAQVGSAFAVGTLLIFLVQWFKALVEHEYSAAFSEMIWPILIIFLLHNNGAVLATATQGLRQVINSVNQRVLTSTAGSIQLQEAYQEAQLKGGQADLIAALLSQCQSLTDAQQQAQCFEDANRKAQEILSNAPPSQQGGFFDSFNPVTAAVQGVASMFRLSVRGWLIAFSIAFQWMIEICMLLTGLLGPLAVGGSLLPVGQKAIFAWLTAFFSVGMVKLSFNIIAGLVATLVVNGSDSDPMIFAFAVGLLAPLLSVAIAAGGGMAVFNSLATVSTLGLSTVFKVGQGKLKGF